MKLTPTFLFPLFALVAIGCGSGDAMESTGSSTQAMDRPLMKNESVTAADGVAVPEAGRASLASQQVDPRLKTAASIRRAVIRNATLVVRVASVEESEKTVDAYIGSRGGYVVSSESSDLNETAPQITMKVRIPVDSFDAGMLKLESLGHRMSKKVSGEDVTAQLVDLDARLSIMRAQEDSFRNMLSRASNQSEALDLQTRIMSLRTEIESLSAQRKTTGDLAALSTIDLTLVGESKGIAATEDKGWASESWNSATTSFGGVLRVLGSLAIFMLVFSPVWIPLGFLAWRGSRSLRHPAKARPDQGL